ncbi:polysaccharide biosynthesis protein [Melghiribacillus thermohalophilus]|uniref:Polysaccharide biosynthesis protein n=1 Tax=Melghiribacillus thermohalophilus TaxID=1324956 RepID=A0A4R3N6Y4_9BACI|nr:polysaccharide biosynthesis protein [Melghiribacillus thermohalophilus]TCT25018.1 polysaccharide biosynthesis protein [Melghiribacillus thermohalophilus]
MFENRKILITGGTGSWGQELTRQILKKNPSEVRIFSRNESSQVEMKQMFNEHPALFFILGDVRDQKALSDACKGVDYIFHLAALKHVPVCEYQPYEALKTNVTGTRNVIEAALVNQVENVIYISTDKAANPANFYGFTKAIGEKLFIHANTLSSRSKFICIRSGNVLGTNGSVIHVFKDQMERKGKIEITDRRMTRFFLTIEDAVELLFRATEESIGGEIFVMKMPAIRIIDLAHVLIEHSGSENINIEEKGLRPGEKIHELLLTEFESNHTVVYKDHYYIILPPIEIEGVREHYKHFPAMSGEIYHSNYNLMSKLEIKRMLEKGGFL